MSRWLRIFFIIIFLLLIIKGIDHFFFSDSLSIKLSPRRTNNAALPKEQTALQDNSLPQRLNADESGIKRALLTALISAGNEYIVYLKNGKQIQGLKQAEDEDYLTLKQVFGYSGAMVTKIPKTEVLKIVTKDKEQNIEITREEIEIKKEFPDFNFFRKGKYSFFTDQDYFKIAKNIELLESLHNSFMGVFSPLAENTLLNRQVYVIIFGKQHRYDSFRQKVAPNLHNAAGFYNAKLDLLAFFDFFQGQDYQKAVQEAKKEQDKVRQELLSSYLSRVAFSAKGMNIKLVRHEGSHQLSYDLGMIQGVNFDIWLVEGLAEYCSTQNFGQKDTQLLKIFQQAIEKKAHISLRELFSSTPGGKFYTLEKEKLGLAYAESWALFYFLMQPHRRDRFFVYIANLKKENSRTLNSEERIKFLEDNLGISSEELENQLISFVKGK